VHIPLLRALGCLLAVSCFSTGTGRALTILPLGDSITYGYLSSAEQGSNGYRAQLYSDLGGNVNFVGSQTDGNLAQPNNEGHNGYTIEGIDAELTANNNTQPGRSDSNNGGYWLTSGTPGGTPLNPDVVLLDVGTNDATDYEYWGTMLDQLTTLLNDLKTDLPNAQIFVGNLTLRNDNVAFESEESAFNYYVPGIVAGLDDPNFHFVDIYTAVGTNENTTDGVHPTTEGYAQMGNAWYNALVAADIVAVPEPSTYALMFAGLAFLGFLVRRKGALVK
jgi:serralysin